MSKPASSAVHIVIVTSSYPDVAPGSEAAGGFVSDFACSLCKHARVSVVAAARSQSSSQEDDLVVHRFAVPKWPLSSLRPAVPSDWPAIYTTLRRGAATLDGLVASQKVDFIFALWALPSAYWARSVKRRYDVPYGVWALGSDVWSLGRIPIARQILARVVRDADLCFADGVQLAADVARIAGRACEFLPSSRKLRATSERVIPTAGPYRLAFLGRWHPNKGIDVFLGALEQLSDDDWAGVEQVRINGGGPLQQVVHDTVDRLRSRGRPVELGGYLDRTRARDLILWSDYVCLPSRVESIPVILSDAAQLGRPLVATPVGDLPAIHARHSFGVLSKSPAVGDYAAALRHALSTDPSQFGSDLLSLAAEFDVDATARRIASNVAAIT